MVFLQQIIFEYLTFRSDHHLLYVHLRVENLDPTRLAKGEIPTKGCMAGKNTSKFIEYKNNYTIDYEDCLLDEGNDPIKYIRICNYPFICLHLWQ